MSVLYIAATGAGNPTRASIPLHVAANGSIETGQECAVVLVGDGVELAVRGGPGLAARVLRAIDREAAALAARVGRVVDGHGDLRPEHVCLEPPLVIDPLELDDLRMIDAASELAFFALECERLDASWFGQRVFARYCHRTGDSIAPAVLAIYRAQHALARALIALRHMDDGPSDPARWRTRAADYLARAS